MAKKNRSNLNSPKGIDHACDLGNLDSWFRQEADAVSEPVVRDIVLSVHEHIEAFVRWPQKALLLWEGRDRSTKYHCYPAAILGRAKLLNLSLDGRVNGPAIAAYQIAGGVRPPRFGSNNSWSVHHVYSGKFPYMGRVETVHAAHCGGHCTQSAGLVAIHPIADQMCDEYPFFAWFLRAMSFERFGYDPDEVFSGEAHDQYGFTTRGHSIIVGAQANG